MKHKTNSTQIKIANIVGARPQFIKYFPLQRALKDSSIKDLLIHTGQHYDYEMSEVFFRQLGIKEPDYHLGIGSGAHGEQTGKIIIEVEKVLKKEVPDLVIVYGDTNSTLAGALAAAKLHIPVAHIEASLRSFNKHMPEEINRVLTDHISSILFCPTRQAIENLKKEGFTNIIKEGHIIDLSEEIAFPVLPSASNPYVINCGDIMFDAMVASLEIATKTSNVLYDLDLSPKAFNLLTIHRAENTDDKERFKSLLDFVASSSDSKKTLFPAHPRSKKFIEENAIKLPESIIISKPFGYLDTLVLLRNSHMLFTDSGGMQKEAYWLKVPCIILRNETEWVETIESGWNVLYKDYTGNHSPKVDNSNVYGDGRAAEKIVRVLCSKFYVRVKM